MRRSFCDVRQERNKCIKKYLRQAAPKSTEKLAEYKIVKAMKIIRTGRPYVCATR